MYSVKLIVLAVNYLPAFSFFFHYCVLLNNCEVSFLRHFSISLIITFHDLYDAFNCVIFSVSYISPRQKLFAHDVRKTYIYVLRIHNAFFSLEIVLTLKRSQTRTHFALYPSNLFSVSGFLNEYLWTVLAKLSGH